ncbi:TPA: hypothetical protein ACH9KF_005395, partial [Escherichia coli]
SFCFRFFVQGNFPNISDNEGFVVFVSAMFEGYSWRRFVVCEQEVVRFTGQVLYLLSGEMEVKRAPFWQ